MSEEIHFWATVCKTVALIYKTVIYPVCLVCLSVCLSVLSVTLVYCGRTVGRIKIKLGVRVVSALATLC